MSVEEKYELLKILWEAIEKEDYKDDAEEETEEELKLLRKGWKNMRQTLLTE